jgi:heat shock protein HtpX
MATLYTEQTKNVRKTWFLISVFLAIIISLGWFASYYFGDPIILIIAIIVSISMSITSYWWSDKIALSATGAKLANENTYLELHRIVENLAITAGLPKPRIYIIDDPAPNAFATGRDAEHSAIAFTTGILALLNKTELEGVAAHELSHIGNRDILLSTVVVVLAGTIVLIGDFFWRMSLLGKSGDDKRTNSVIMIVGLVLIMLSPVVAELIKLAISRKREFLADASGALLTRYPEGLALALEKISKYDGKMKTASDATAHLFISNPFGHTKKSLTNLFSTHPPVEERVKALLHN